MVKDTPRQRCRHRAIRWTIAPTALIVAVTSLSACAADRAQYQDDGERFLTGEEVFGAYGIDFQDPSCEAPASTAPGTTFACTAQGDDGLTYGFTMQITGDNEFVLTAITPVYPTTTSG